MNNKNTGAFISDLRKSLGLSQKELAAKLNVTDKAVSKWETGRCLPDVSILIPLSEILGVSVTEIIKGEKICQEDLCSFSNEVISNSLKRTKKIQWLIIGIIVLVTFSLLSAFPLYHYCSTVESNNHQKIVEEAKSYFENNEIELITFTRKSNRVAFLFSDSKQPYILIFEEDRFFKDRLDLENAAYSTSEHGLGLCCYGSNGETVFVMFGSKLSPGTKKYSFWYRGTEHIKSIENEYVLDVFIDKDDGFTNPTIMSVGNEIIIHSKN